jgi:hypothetical protein
MTRTTTSRGYGASHQRLRQRWATIVEAGDAICARCDLPIPPDGPWDLGHTDDRTAYQGAEHRDCNRSAGGRNGAAATNAKKATTVRAW